MPVSPDKQILIRFRVPPSSQGSITRRHSNRDFPTKLSAKNCRGMYRDNWWNWYASWIYWSTQPPKQAVSREVTSFLLLSCQRCHHGWLVDYYPKWGVKWLLILPFSSLTICTGNLEWPPRLLRRARPAGRPCLARPRRQCKVKTKKKAGKPSSSSVTTLTSCLI